MTAFVIVAAIKVAVVFGAILGTVLFTIWLERRLVARMQSRFGPNRWGPMGLLTSLADGVKLFFKEQVSPYGIDRAAYVAAPILALIPAFLAFAAIPFGEKVTLLGQTITFEIADLNVGLLWVLAMGSLAVYGIVLAGWSSGSKYPLLGGIRSTAQMISYEIAISLSLVPVVVWAGSLSLREIVEGQIGTFGNIEWLPGPFQWIGHLIPKWYVVWQLPAFLLFMAAGVAETNRAPFDLPEAETELVAGYHTEYSGIKFAMFFLSEYVHIITISAVAVIMFLGGWDGPHLPFLPWVWPIMNFMGKTFTLVFLFIWLRATLPRIRYDKLMVLGWKGLIPMALGWLVVSSTILTLKETYLG